MGVATIKKHDENTDYTFPTPPKDCKDLNNAQLFVLKKLYKRIKEVPKLNPYAPETLEKFQALKKMYLEIAEDSTLDTNYLLAKILQHEIADKDILFKKRTSNIFNTLSITATENMLHDIKKRLQKEALKQKNTTPNLDYFANTLTEIKTIFQQTQSTIDSIVENQLPNSEEEWHQKFIEYKKITFAKPSHADLKKAFINENYDQKVNHWIYTDYYIKKNKTKTETSLELSQRAAQESTSYNNELTKFKKKTVEAQKSFVLHSQAGNEIAKSALSDIKKLIENVDWELGRWGSSSKITVDGKKKAIPNHIYQIYQLCLQGEKSSDAMSLFTRIHTICVDTQKPRSNRLFKSLKERQQSTQNTYRVIQESSEALLELADKTTISP